MLSHPRKTFICMASIPKVFRSIPLHVNPEQPGDEEPTPSAPWLCDLSFLASTVNPASIFAIGLDDPEINRFMFCKSICVSVKETLVIPQHEHNPMALHHQRSYAMLRRQQSSSIGSFLHNLSLAVTGENRLRAFMMADDEDDEDAGSPSETSALTLMLYFDIDSILSPIARAAGIITGSEEIEHISLSFEFSRTARAAHVASLALMMAAHDRLGAGSTLGRMLGTDMLRLICDAYRLRLYECRRHVWNE
jgi:hypothetical protein